MRRPLVQSMPGEAFLACASGLAVDENGAHVLEDGDSSSVTALRTSAPWRFLNVAPGLAITLVTRCLYGKTDFVRPVPSSALLVMPRLAWLLSDLEPAHYPESKPQ
jgi:hypothetical protein